MNKLFLTISLLLLLSCNNEISLDDALMKISKETPITLDNWEVAEKLGSKGHWSYVLMQTKSDTTHIINFNIDNQDVSLFYHDIRFSDTNYDYFLRRKSDTSYFYKINKLDSVTTFIQGEYNFKDRRMKHTTGQMEYYRLHQDSLDKIKGNNLPELPEIQTTYNEYDSIVADEPVE